MKTNNLIKQSSYPLIITIIVLMILGFALSPLLKVKLLPDCSLPSISVYYSYGGANAVVVDSEVTSPMEAIFSNLGGLVGQSSRTGDGNGAITLEMEKDADMDAVRFEVSAMVRMLLPQLPQSVPQVVAGRRQYQAYQTWKDASDIYNAGAFPECLDDFAQAYPFLKTNNSFLVQYGKALEMGEKYDSSIVILNQAKVHLNNTILYTCLGNNYKALGKNTESEQAYLHAWHMAPARFYPLYLLAKLYDETGQNERAVAMAKRVMEKDVKVESTAIEEIKEEMQQIITQYASLQNSN